jgi:ubiquinone/menaquinone biosynthesis C-methylase UbiE
MASERQANAENSPWWGEHLHRYEVVERELAGSDSILDLACGTGYGAALLARKTKGKVIGGDLSEEALERCRASWGSERNLEFRKLDGTGLDFPAGSFEKVVSFETIEHTRDFDLMLSEFNRVLKPGGSAFISTPNFPVSSPGGVVTNPYHTQEFALEEFMALMEKNFSAPKIYGQKYVRYESESGPLPTIAKGAEWILYQRGFRKIPLGVQNGIMNTLLGKPQYPLPGDFSLVRDEAEIRKCKTLFAICGKK